MDTFGQMLSHYTEVNTKETEGVWQGDVDLGKLGQAGPAQLQEEEYLHPAGPLPGEVTQDRGRKELQSLGTFRTFSRCLSCLIFIVVPRSAEIITAQFLPP